MRKRNLIIAIAAVLTFNCSFTQSQNINMENQTHVIEMVLFKAKENVNKDEVEKAMKSLNGIVSTFNGFIERKTAVAEDGQWIDLVYWTDLASAQKASEAIMKNEKSAEIFKVIDESTMIFIHFKVKNNYKNQSENMMNRKEENSNIEKVEAFSIIGISVRTSNENGQAGNDIGALFGRFMSEGLLEKIPNKIDNTLYSLYTEYKGDHTKPYTAILGCKVKNLEAVPEGMIGKSFDGGKYMKLTSRGDLTKGFVYGEWLKIWDMDIDRAYTVDFETYGEKAQNPTDAEVDIFVGIK